MNIQNQHLQIYKKGRQVGILIINRQGRRKGYCFYYCEPINFSDKQQTVEHGYNFYMDAFYGQ